MFRSWKQQQLLQLCRLLNVFTVPEEVELCREGAPAESLFFVLGGTVDLRCEASTEYRSRWPKAGTKNQFEEEVETISEEIKFRTIGPGTVFGAEKLLAHADADGYYTPLSSSSAGCKTKTGSKEVRRDFTVVSSSVVAEVAQLYEKDFAFLTAGVVKAIRLSLAAQDGMRADVIRAQCVRTMRRRRKERHAGESCYGKQYAARIHRKVDYSMGETTTVAPPPRKTIAHFSQADPGLGSRTALENMRRRALKRAKEAEQRAKKMAEVRSRAAVSLPSLEPPMTEATRLRRAARIAKEMRQKTARAQTCTRDKAMQGVTRQVQDVRDAEQLESARRVTARATRLLRRMETIGSTPSVSGSLPRPGFETAINRQDPRSRSFWLDPFFSMRSGSGVLGTDVDGPPPAEVATRFAWDLRRPLDLSLRPWERGLDMAGRSLRGRGRSLLRPGGASEYRSGYDESFGVAVRSTDS